MMDIVRFTPLLIISDKKYDASASPQLGPRAKLFVASVTRFFLTSTPRFCYFRLVFILESSLQVNPFLNNFCKQVTTGYTLPCIDED
jgi:hypothetical protein